MWLFGWKSNTSENREEKNSKPNSFDAARFDSKSLEKAAQAAKTLEQSKYATEILNLSHLSNANDEQMKAVQIMEYEAYLRRKELEKLMLSDEDRKKKIQEDLNKAKQRLHYENENEMKRYMNRLQQQQKNLESVKRHEEQILLKQELKKRAELDRDLSSYEKNELKKIEKKLAVKAKMDRENQDINLEMIKVKAQEQRALVLESIDAFGKQLSSGLNAFYSNWDKVLKTAGGISLVILGAYGAKHSTGVLFKAIENRLLKPSLIQETSRITPDEFFKHPVTVAKRLLSKPEDALKGIILKPSLEEQLLRLAKTTRNTKINKGKYENLLMHGPPGTGKSLFAKKLAFHSGMDYALMSGGDVKPLGRDGVTALNKVFTWGQTSRRGLLLIIDEAEGFLQKRSLEDVSEDTRATMSKFLAMTGEHSNKIMLVLATNLPEQLDSAILNRINIIIKFELPGLQERERILHYYFDECILTPLSQGKCRFKLETFDYSALLKEVARRTEGLSGRGLTNLVRSWESVAYASEDGILTREAILKKTDAEMKALKQRDEWVKDQLLERNYLLRKQEGYEPESYPNDHNPALQM